MKQQTYLCIRRRRKILNKNLGGGGKMKSLFFRNGSFGMFNSTDVSGTLECNHMATIGNGTPCIVVQKKGK
jgi:hypothetical protein